MAKDLCPVAAEYKEINLANHQIAIEYANLGPADPREPSTLYWQQKMDLWQVGEGVARSRLCMNCSHYDNSEETLMCIKTGEGGTLKASEVDPTWADIPDMPSAVCTRWSITCSALRTCDSWEDPNKDPDNANVLFESMEDDETEKADEIDLKPTKGMADEARKALDWKKEGHRGGTLVGLARANQLVKRENLSKETVMRMYSFFSRHEVDKQAEGFRPGEKGYPSPGRVAWGLWGGDPGYSWSRTKRNQLMKED